MSDGPIALNPDFMDALIDALAEPWPGDDEVFLDCWPSPETRQRIAATVARLGA